MNPVVTKPPPSIYPLPIVDPAPALQTTYAFYHGSHPPRDREFFRTRTMNPLLANTYVPWTDANEIYPQHGTGSYTLPYYRKDSQGFRRPYTQPAEVDVVYDENVSMRRTRSLQNERVSPSWAHPSSRPNYRAATGRTIMTSPPEVSLAATEPSLRTLRPSTQSRATQPLIPEDPSLRDPVMNAYSRSRTVYKRSFGKCA